MPHKFSTNFVIDGPSDNISCYWRLTRVMKSSGWVVKAHSDGVTKVSAGTNANDSWGLNAEPLNDTLPVNFKTATYWTVLQGPSTFKIPITVAPGSMIRGERVIQASSGAVGELLGIVFDAGTGYAVVAPRTGIFNSINVITGSQSGLSFTPSSVIAEFVREVMLAKYTTSLASIQVLYICADKSEESPQLYSTLAASAGCTPLIPPACGGTSNLFPALGIVLRGAAGAATASIALNGNIQGMAQIGCANMVGSSTETVDGSFYLAGNTVSTSMQGMIFTRMDNTEPGDLDPYLFYFPLSNPISTWTRVATAAPIATSSYLSSTFLDGNTACCVGYESRGSGIVGKDIVSTYLGATLQITGNPIASYYYTSALTVLNNLSATPSYIRLPIWMMAGKQTTSVNFPQVKGSMRWMFLSGVGNKLDLFDVRKTLCISSLTSQSVPAVCIGPYDGTTIALG